MHQRECPLLSHPGRSCSKKDLRIVSKIFKYFQRMSPRMRSALKSSGIDDFKTAMDFVEGMKETTGLKEYSLSEFIRCTCLLDGVVFDG